MSMKDDEVNVNNDIYCAVPSVMFMSNESTAEGECLWSGEEKIMLEVLYKTNNLSAIQQSLKARIAC